LNAESEQKSSRRLKEKILISRSMVATMAVIIYFCTEHRRNLCGLEKKSTKRCESKRCTVRDDLIPLFHGPALLNPVYGQVELYRRL
ncbi:hypothetical protein T02_5137, partial [Trichinella nativa]